ncbi:MAG: DNA-3-methyladenine glycosylase I [Calditrichaeota bacterium]|nr:DNA-3-methyladenine glycosylase I [Calditrichota bacterium]
MDNKRCEWVPLKDELYVAYHDTEWGVPVYDDQKLFEFLILEGFQAGLSWRTVLYKRENFRQAFDYFDPQKIARYDQEKVKELMENAGIIRNRLKIEASIGNARSFLQIQEQYGSFSDFIWRFTDGKPIVNHWRSIEEIPARTELSDLISKELKKLGFRFVGSTIIYAHLQATGMVNDHVVHCFRHRQLAGE